jgi:hypothetical protein
VVLVLVSGVLAPACWLTATPLHPVIHGKIDGGDRTVEKVYFGSLAGFYVTRNLYRRKGQDGPRPGVFNPHGRFPGGRFQDVGREAVSRQIAQGLRLTVLRELVRSAWSDQGRHAITALTGRIPKPGSSDVCRESRRS